MENSKPPMWAFETAAALANQEGADWGTISAMDDREGTRTIRAFARYIAAHEQPPVDPDVLFVRKMMVLWMCTPDEFGNAGRGQAGQIERGERDDKPDFQAVLEFYREHKEAGK